MAPGFGHRSGDPFKGWTYDDLGNHLTQNEDGTTTPGSFNAVNEQTSRGGTSLNWSKTGNLTEDDQGRQYSYDRQNMLTRVKNSGGTIVFEAKYDALGRRIEVTNPGAGTTHRLYFDAMPDQRDPRESFNARIIERTDGSGTVQQSYVWGNYIDELLLYDNEATGNEYYALRNNNYDVTAVISMTGTVVERYDYNPYGERFVLDADYSDDSDDQSDIALRFGHQGLYHDTTTGLVYNRARMLHTQLGRFTTRDSLGYVDGMSLYQYVRSRPVFNTDPTGQWSVPSLNISSKIGVAGFGAVPFPVPAIGGGIFVRYDVSITKGTCCENGQTKNYEKIQGTFEIGVYGGVMKPAVHVRTPVIEDIRSCPNPKNNWDGGFTFRATAGPVTAQCRWLYNSGWSCEASIVWTRWGGASAQASGTVVYKEASVS